MLGLKSRIQPKSPSWRLSPRLGAVTCTAIFIPIFLATCSTISLPGPSQASTAPDLDTQTSLLIKQFSEPSGELEIFFSPLGIKINNKHKGAVAVLVPPYKVGVMYNEHSKRIYYCSPEVFKSPYAQSMALLHALTFTEIQLSPHASTRWQGLSATVFGLSQEFETAQRAKMARREIAVKAPASIRCLQSSKLKVRPEISSFLDRFYGFPLTAGLPLDFTYNNFRGEQHHYMYTSQVSVRTFKSSDYVIPTGYTRVKDIQELVLDDSAQDSIEMMIGK
jgi:hypothetical protein